MKLWLDVDTGSDDALAIMLAFRWPGASVLGISCAPGNTPVVNVARNTLSLLDLIDAPATPVAIGMRSPLIEQLREPNPLHGRDGIGDLFLPASGRSLAPEHAVELLRGVLEAATEPISLVALAPLTNIAVLIRMYPHLREKIAMLMIMGGTYLHSGNTSPAAEFNIRQDPEAAAIVLASGWPITLYPLDPFIQTMFSRAEILALEARPQKLLHTAGHIMHTVMDNLKREMSTIGDAGALAVLLDGSHATTVRAPVSVELVGSVTRGSTVLDRRRNRNLSEWWDTSPHEIDVITHVDAEYYKALYVNTLEKVPV